MAVVGNGEEAGIDALFLSEIASRILLITHRQELNIQGTLIDRLRNKSNIELINAEVKQILGGQIVKSIKILEYGVQGTVEKDANGVFVSLGGVPITDLVKNAGINTDGTGCLIVDRQQKTSIEGVFAAGDLLAAVCKWSQRLEKGRWPGCELLNMLEKSRYSATGFCFFEH